MDTDIWRKSSPGRENSKCRSLQLRVRLLYASDEKEEYKYMKENVVEDGKRGARQELMGREFCIYSSSDGDHLRVLSRRVTELLYTLKSHFGHQIQVGCRTKSGSRKK